MPNINRAKLVLPAVFALFFVAAACGNEDSLGAADTAEAPPATTEGSQAEGSANTSAVHSISTTASAAPAGEVRLLIDNQPADADLSHTQCEWGSDDGVEQLEFDAGREDSGRLEVEIDMHNPPRLDDFEFDGPGDEDWEAEDHHRDGAQIGIEGDTYTVTSTVENGDDDDDDGAAREAQMVAVFTCPR